MVVKVVPTPVFEHDYDLKSEEYEVWEDKHWLASFRYEHDAENFARVIRRSLTISELVDENEEILQRLADR